MEKIPTVGLGTWKASPGEVTEAVKVAIDTGYRHIDCAHLYQNETEVGLGIQYKIKEGVVRREDLFIVSKLWCTYHEPSLVQIACKKSLKSLKLDYLDLYLMHWPMGFQPGEEDLPLDPNGMVKPSDTNFLDTWEAMEDLVIKGLVKDIGVSNFNHEQLERLLNKPDLKIKPVTNQVRMSQWLFYLESWQQIDANLPFHMENWKNFIKKGTDLLNNPTIQRIAEHYGKSCAQILIRFQIQRNLIVIPKSTNPNRIQENIQVFDFELTEDHMDEIMSLDRHLRLVTFPTTENHKDYPFHIDF